MCPTVNLRPGFCNTKHIQHTNSFSHQLKLVRKTCRIIIRLVVSKFQIVKMHLSIYCCICCINKSICCCICCIKVFVVNVAVFVVVFVV